MLTKKQKVHGIIHAAAAGAASVGGGLAQLPTADTIPITALQVGMVQGIALLYGRELREASAASIVLTFTAGLIGRAMSQLLVGWVPVLGNAINAATAASLTEAVGWAAHAFFERLGNESLSGEELGVRASAIEKRDSSAQEQPRPSATRANMGSVA